MTVKKRLNIEIRKAMAEYELDQKHLARRLRISEATMSTWIANPDKLTMEKMALLNRELHLPASVLAVALGCSR